MFDPPFYDIIFSWSPFFVNYFYSIPRFHQPSPPRELKNDNSLNCVYNNWKYVLYHIKQ